MDLVLGDPANRFHPVAYLGRFIGFLDKLLNRGKFLRFKGALLVLIVVPAAFLLANTFLVIAYAASELLGGLVSVVILWFSISVKKLAHIALSISKNVQEGRLCEARNVVGRIVGRETKNLSHDGISRATIESVSENFVDSLVAPLLFALIGGPQLAFAYRALNTIDAMIGYKNDKYRLFGWAGARLDDAANYIPARLSVFFLAFAAFIVRASAAGTLRSVLLFARNHASPNSGFPEAAAAGALGIKLGGPSVYFGREVSHGYIGNGSDPEPADIGRSVNLIIIASAIVAIAFSLMDYLATGKTF